MIENQIVKNIIITYNKKPELMYDLQFFTDLINTNGNHFTH